MINQIKFDSKLYNKLMLSLIFIYTFLFFPFPDISKIIFKFFLLLSIPLFFIRFNCFKKDVMFILMIFSFLIQTISWISSIIYFPDLANEYPKLDRLAKLFSFIFIAYWLKGSIQNVAFVLVFFVFGLIVEVLNYPTFFNHLKTGIVDGYRVIFGLKNSQFTSMLTGVSIIILFCLIAFHDFSKRKLTVILNFSLYPLMFFLLLLFILSQSRQAWLALLIVFFFLPLICFFIGKIKNKTKILLSYFIFFVLIFLLSQIEIVNNRVINHTVIKESELFQSLLTAEINSIPSIGNGIRVNSWIEAFEWITKHPFIGNGPNAVGQVIQESDKFSIQQKMIFNHLHNFHIEILVAYGLLGSILIYSMYFWFIKTLLIAQKRDASITGYAIMGVMFLLFWAIVNIFESISSRSFGVYVHNIMFGCLYTFYFTQQRKKIEEAESCA